MTRIKLCGLSRPQDIDVVNELMPEYIGFVFAKKSRRYVTPQTAATLRSRLNPRIQAVGVFVNAPVQEIAALLDEGILDAAQLHGSENGTYMEELHARTDKPLIQAFRIDAAQDVQRAAQSSADLILLDSGSGGTGTCFDWTLLQGVKRPYFLAGGLTPENAGKAVRALCPYAVDVSSGIETGGMKDAEKMRAFVQAVRGAQK